MGKIVGKLLVLVTMLLCMSGINATSLFLRAVDTDRRELQQVAVGQPFILEVTMHDVGRALQAPTIVGIEQMHARRTSVRMNTVNEKSTVHYDYTARIDEPGAFKVGPAVIVLNGNRVASNMVSITAGEQAVQQASSGKTKKSNPQAFLRFLVDNERVVVGQKVTCALRFYYSDDSVSLKQISPSDYGGFKKTQEEGPYRGAEKVDGKLYHYAEWRWQLYPQEPGKKMLPACRADFDVSSVRDNFLRGFSLFFNSRVDRKRVYSNAVHLHVEPLPPYTEPVQAIGSFKHLKASLKPSVAKEGEGMVLTVELEGEGNIDILDQFVLRSMPEVLRYYDSKKYMVDSQQEGELPKKRFEFIVQGLKIGDWEIPSQTFTYFDVEKKRYETLKSGPIITSILRGVLQPGVQTAQTHALHDVYFEEQKVSDELAPINHDGPWYPVRDRTPLPLSLFVLLSSLPLLSGLYYLFLQSLERYRRRNNVHLRAKHAFSHARAQLKQAVRKGNVTDLYSLFVQLIAHRCMIPVSELSTNRIEQLLTSKEVSADELVNWNYFFSQLAEGAFGKKKTMQSDDSLFKQAEQWIRHLEKLL